MDWLAEVKLIDPWLLGFGLLFGVCLLIALMNQVFLTIRYCTYCIACAFDKSEPKSENHISLEKKNIAYQRQNMILETRLNSLEWKGPDGCCPVCNSSQVSGHKKDCWFYKEADDEGAEDDRL